MQQLEGHTPRGAEPRIERRQRRRDLQEGARVLGVVGALQGAEGLPQAVREAAKGLPVAHRGAVVHREAAEQEGDAQQTGRPAALLHLQAGGFGAPATSQSAGRGETPGLRESTI